MNNNNHFKTFGGYEYKEDIVKIIFQPLVNTVIDAGTGDDNANCNVNMLNLEPPIKLDTSYNQQFTNDASNYGMILQHISSQPGPGLGIRFDHYIGIQNQQIPYQGFRSLSFVPEFTDSQHFGMSVYYTHTVANSNQYNRILRIDDKHVDVANGIKTPNLYTSNIRSHSSTDDTIHIHDQTNFYGNIRCYDNFVVDGTFTNIHGYFRVMGNAHIEGSSEVDHLIIKKTPIYDFTDPELYCQVPNITDIHNIFLPVGSISQFIRNTNVIIKLQDSVSVGGKHISPVRCIQNTGWILCNGANIPNVSPFDKLYLFLFEVYRQNNIELHEDLIRNEHIPLPNIQFTSNDENVHKVTMNAVIYSGNLDLFGLEDEFGVSGELVFDYNNYMFLTNDSMYESNSSTHYIVGSTSRGDGTTRENMTMDYCNPAFARVDRKGNPPTIWHIDFPNKTVFGTFMIRTIVQNEDIILASLSYVTADSDDMSIFDIDKEYYGLYGLHASSFVDSATIYQELSYNAIYFIHDGFETSDLQNNNSKLSFDYRYFREQHDTIPSLDFLFLRSVMKVVVYDDFIVTINKYSVVDDFNTAQNYGCFIRILSENMTVVTNKKESQLQELTTLDIPNFIPFDAATDNQQLYIVGATLEQDRTDSSLYLISSCVYKLTFSENNTFIVDCSWNQKIGGNKGNLATSISILGNKLLVGGVFLNTTFSNSSENIFKQSNSFQIVLSISDNTSTDIEFDIYDSNVNILMDHIDYNDEYDSITDTYSDSKLNKLYVLGRSVVNKTEYRMFIVVFDVSSNGDYILDTSFNSNSLSGDIPGVMRNINIQLAIDEQKRHLSKTNAEGESVHEFIFPRKIYTDSRDGSIHVVGHVNRYQSFIAKFTKEGILYGTKKMFDTQESSKDDTEYESIAPHLAHITVDPLTYEIQQLSDNLQKKVTILEYINRLPIYHLPSEFIDGIDFSLNKTYIIIHNLNSLIYKDCSFTSFTLKGFNAMSYDTYDISLLRIENPTFEKREHYLYLNNMRIMCLHVKDVKFIERIRIQNLHVDKIILENLIFDPVVVYPHQLSFTFIQNSDERMQPHIFGLRIVDEIVIKNKSGGVDVSRNNYIQNTLSLVDIYSDVSFIDELLFFGKNKYEVFKGEDISYSLHIDDSSLNGTIRINPYTDISNQLVLKYMDISYIFLSDISNVHIQLQFDSIAYSYSISNSNAIYFCGYNHYVRGSIFFDNTNNILRAKNNIYLSDISCEKCIIHDIENLDRLYVNNVQIQNELDISFSESKFDYGYMAVNGIDTDGPVWNYQNLFWNIDSSGLILYTGCDVRITIDSSSHSITIDEQKQFMTYDKYKLFFVENFLSTTGDSPFKWMTKISTGGVYTDLSNRIYYIANSDDNPINIDFRDCNNIILDGMYQLLDGISFTNITISHICNISDASLIFNENIDISLSELLNVDASFDSTSILLSNRIHMKNCHFNMLFIDCPKPIVLPVLDIIQIVPMFSYNSFKFKYVNEINIHEDEKEFYKYKLSYLVFKHSFQ